MLIEQLVRVFCLEDAAVLNTGEHHCPPAPSVHINGDGWRESLVHPVGTRCSVLEGNGVEGLVQGHMVSLGQSWHKRAQSSAFLRTCSLLKALTGPWCSYTAVAGMQAWQVAGLGVGNRLAGCRASRLAEYRRGGPAFELDSPCLSCVTLGR